MAQIGIEEELMLAYQNGDKQAGEKLYVLIKPALYTFLYRFNRNEQLSIDLVQDTFLMLERKKHMYEVEKGKVKTYLFQIGYRLMINKLNRRKKWHSLLPFFVPIQEKEFSQEDRITVREAMLKVPEDQRAVLILSYYHDMPQKEIAQVLSIPVGTVKSRLHNGIKKLKQLLEVDDIERKSF
ncbi:RNA polymerase sigma factor [Bacillus cytotoxicus]|uniref:RNA polymerase sigma-70 factor, ECF sub n=1 Tax=Bacillus cytotoxicus TaxID=580165 RepID=A0AAX2CLT3_9BACI|nr:MULTISPECIES: RNA polymerase sigma factor [Bacillus cereus group]AWC34196.1 RNA polymerase sigma factor [Bacillus cytotoxicus]AWC38194.1 RNA polymerase sigma factor [Bacillus cytotoxicus]AWC62408.1 RNA polymerase sigma factor [Bacillus cytotoxicus]KMT48764.1 RNA polymerase sigma70 factor [Bacillus cytotoxicus]MDH2879566.1 RNA polymerase sigma factor [Bacillus cytotoxicus]